ncbi:hypothetical protein HK098_001397 [Nowakowskiella sp. JEL0407]|nr:hypothetical protein HK098_001397 [Nowakowskiella sp. JEL0407]
MSAIKAGPYIRFGNYTLIPPTWCGTILLVVSGPTPPSIRVQSSSPETQFNQVFPAIYLDNYGGFSFYRFDVVVPAKDGSGSIKYVYEVNLETTNAGNFDFHVAGSKDIWRWSFWSCNGFSKETEETKKLDFAAMWVDMMKCHEQSPIFLQVGGGDQVYADPIFEEPCLKEWLAISGKQQRKLAPWTPAMEENCSRFYFELYIRHFLSATMKDALAKIPYVFQPDDHDYFDGWGSYPEYLQNSNVFQNLYRIATRFVLLFQHHSTDQRAPHEGLFGKDGKAYNFLKQMGPGMAILGVDTRSERGLSRVVSPESTDMIFSQLQQLPPSTKHLIVLTGVPIAYPELDSTENTLGVIGSIKESANGALNSVTAGIANAGGAVFGKGFKTGVENVALGIKKSLGKEGLMKKLINRFGEIELNDDLSDHWTNKIHRLERQAFVQKLQQFAKSRKCRVTLIAGDVHVCGCAYFETASTAAASSTTPPVQSIPSNRVADHRYMVQIISSAIVNVPPPAAALNTVLGSAKRYTGVKGLDSETLEDMEVLFAADVNGAPYNKKLMARRNWCLVNPDNIAGQIVFEIRVEGVNGDVRPYRVWVPELSPP